jgi:hypothetical protein
MRISHPHVRSRLWFLWPFWSDTLEPFMVAVSLGAIIGSVSRGDLNLSALILVCVSYPIAILTRRRQAFV